MLTCVTIKYVEGAAVKEISKEEGALSLIPSSTMLLVKAVWVVVPNFS